MATYSQAGASYGFGLLWAALLTLPLMTAVEEICDRTALSTGQGLGALTRRSFGRVARVVLGVLIVLLIVANALNIAADLVAVGAGMHLLHAGPTSLWALAAGAIVSALIISGSFELISRIFKALAAVLLSYLVVLFAAHIDWRSVATHTVIPHLTHSRSYVALVVAVLGTTISPYLFFWQSLHRIEEMRDEAEGGNQPLPLRKRGRRAKGKQRRSRFDVVTGMAFSNLVMFAIIVTAATTLGKHGRHSIASAAEAASALKPIAGRFASTLFALGFIGSGLLAVPVLAGSGAAALSGLTGRPAGFSRSPRQAPVFYSLVLLGTVGGTALSLTGVNPIRLLVFVAIVNGVAAGPFIAVIMRIADNATIMGDYVNGRLARTLGWGTVVLMTVAALLLFAAGGGGGLY